MIDSRNFCKRRMGGLTPKKTFSRVIKRCLIIGMKTADCGQRAMLQVDGSEWAMSGEHVESNMTRRGERAGHSETIEDTEH
ncbi:hypothetical protein TNCV_3220921 [Trichonephila clavipes]|nr:hypothetical protein TNCV_3220921 [Trichonephila clavipes]